MTTTNKKSFAQNTHQAKHARPKTAPASQAKTRHLASPTTGPSGKRTDTHKNDADQKTAVSLMQQIMKVSSSLPSPIKDPLQESQLQKVDDRGQLVYGFDRRQSQFTSPQSFIVSRVNQAGNLVNGPTKVYTIDLEMQDPQLSPDGHYLLFKAFTSERNDQHAVYAFDFVDLWTGIIDVMDGEELRLRIEVPWSPDGRYFAYIQGGDARGDLEATEEAYTLRIFDFKRKRTRTVKALRALPNMCWTPQDTLLFTDELPPAAQSGTGSAAGYHPGLFEFSDKPYAKFLFEGTAPLAASPDGRWIAYHGWIKPPTGADINSGSGAGSRTPAGADAAQSVPGSATTAGDGQLCLFDRVEKRHYAIPAAKFVESVVWTPDSKQLLAINGHAISAISVPDGQVHVIVPAETSEYKDSDGVETFAASYEPCGVSDDGTKLYVKFVASGPPEIRYGREYEYRYDMVRSINLADGTMTTVAKTKDTWGIDWLPEGHKMRMSPVDPTTKPLPNGGPPMFSLRQHKQ